MKQGTTLFEILAFAAVQVALVAAVWRGAPEAREIAGVHNHHASEGSSIYYLDGNLKWGTATIVAPVARRGILNWLLGGRRSDPDDPDIYVGAPGYETSGGDFGRIIR